MMLRRLILGIRVGIRLGVSSLAFALLPAIAHAQIGSATDILTGRVTGPDGKPLENVEVVAQSAETGISRKKRTGSDGRYTILFPDGGGQYRMEFRAIGWKPVQRNVARQGDEDRLVTDVQLGVTVAPRLATVQVTGRNTGPRGRVERPTPGEGGRNLNADQLSRLPVDASDVAAVAALAPGVVPVSSTDSTAAAFSVAGQRTTANNITLDGLSFGNFTVPQEGLRNTRVVTNTYDPSRGQFSGGEIASTTRSGTNELTGGMTYSRRDPTLEFEGSDTATFQPTYLQDQLSGGLGGPIVKDKLFIFGSGQIRRRSDPFQSILSASPATLTALGIQSDSVARFLNTVNGYGIPLNNTSLPTRRIGDNDVGIVRLDYFLSDAHTLTLRGDYRQQTQDPTRNSAFSLPTNSGTSTTTGAGLAATLSSVFENGLINEMRAYLSNDANHADPFLVLPAGRVRITSQLADGTQGISVLSFGGNPGFPQSGHNSLFELSNELSYLSKNRAHRAKLGLLLDLAHTHQDVTSNRLGTFTYNSLADFVNNTPESFTRTLGSQLRDSRTTTGAVYLGDTWRSEQGGRQLVYGFRVEGTHIGNPPPLNSDVQNLFGLRTDRFPSEVHVSPRIGFSVNLTKPNPNDPFAQFQPAFLLRGGVGEFRSKTPTGLFTSAQAATGLTGTEQQVSCIGPAAPAAAWTTYATDESSIPTTCVGGASSTPVFSSVRNSVTLIDPSFETSRAWRSSIGLQHRILDRFTIAADLSYARGVALYGVQDLNLNTTPAFTLANEGNRPVYAPTSAIVTTTGAVSSAASRKFAQYGQVLDVSSNLQSDTRQLTLSLNGGTRSGTLLNVAYTLQRTIDQSSFSGFNALGGFASPTTAGNPNIAEWGPGDMDTRHTLQMTLTQPLPKNWELTSNIRLTSGQPFTPIVGSDINGDGARNDRAFIFDPKTALDPNVAAGMQALLANAPSRVRDCLNEQLGKIAGRNSCRGAWTPSIDLQANARPEGFGLQRRVTFSLVASNVLAGLDQVFHHNNLRGWGQPNRADPTLLYVRGFNPSTQSYIYDVNGRFGTNTGSRNAFRVPFVLALQARLMLGPDPRERFRQIFTQRMDDMQRGMSGEGGAERVMNPIARLIQMRDTLELTQTQVDSLSVISDSLAARTKIIGDSMRAQVAKVKGMGDPQTIFAQLRPMIVKSRQMMNDALTQAQTILTKEQWAKVPDDVKRPRGFGGQGGGPGGERGRGREF